MLQFNYVLLLYSKLRLSVVEPKEKNLKKLKEEAQCDNIVLF